MRLCARGLCDRKGDLLDFRHPLTRDVAYARSTRRRARACTARSASTSRRRRSRAASRRRSSRATSRGRRARARRATSTSRRRTRRATRYQTQLAMRYYLRARSPPARRPAAARRARGARGHLPRPRAQARARAPPRGAAHDGASSSATPRAACLALLRTARFDLDEGHLAHGLPVAKKRREPRARGGSIRASRSRPSSS